MGLTEEVYRVLIEVAMLKIEIGRKHPHNIWYRNELKRMFEEGESLHRKAKEVDELLRVNRFRGIPQHCADDIRREIDIILNNVAFLRHNMAIESQYRDNITRPEANTYQTTYSSSECQSSVHGSLTSSSSTSSQWNGIGFSPAGSSASGQSEP